LLSGESNRYFKDDRVPIYISEEVRKNLRGLLFEKEMFAVGYSEFIQRAIEHTRDEIENPSVVV
jgi:hypothetical protein